MTSSLDDILSQFTSGNRTPHQDLTLLNRLLPDDVNHRDLILAAQLQDGSDPLVPLVGTNGAGVQRNTILILYILVARLGLFLPQGPQNQGNVVPPPPPEALEQWCRHFDADSARLCPQFVTYLSNQINFFCLHMGRPKNAVELQENILTRYAPALDILTTVHSAFLYACIHSKSYMSTLPLLLHHPITGVTPSQGVSLKPYPSTDLVYNDVMKYHYLAGHVLTALRRWSEAEEYYEAVVTHPGNVVGAIQLEALKRLRMVQVIGRGECPPLPKQIHPNLPRSFKSTPYSAFIAAYPTNMTLLKALVDGTQNFGESFGSDNKPWHSDKNSKDIFLRDKNYGLMLEALERAPKWALKKLTSTYVTLGLDEIAQLLGVTEEDEVQRLVLEMIESKSINASMSYDESGRCTVRFEDDEVNYTKDQIDKILRVAQTSALALQNLDDETSRSKDYLTKALKARNNDGEVAGGGAGGMYGSGGMMEDEPWAEADMVSAY